MTANSRFEKINTVLQTIASIATTFGVILILWQAVIARQAFEAQGWQAISSQIKDIDKIFIEYPDLYPYFYQRKQINSDDPQYPKVAATAEMLLDFMDGFEDEYVRGLGGMDDEGSSWAPWKNYFEGLFQLSPVLCSRFNEIESWYIKEGVVYSLAKAGCAKGMLAPQQAPAQSSNSQIRPNNAN